MNLLKLEIVTPEGLIFAKDVKSVTLPGSEGEFGVLPGHAALVSLLKAGIVDVELDNGAHEVVAINWGHATIDEEKIIILAEGAVAIEGDDDGEISKALSEAKKLLESIGGNDVTMASTIAKIDNLARKH